VTTGEVGDDLTCVVVPPSTDVLGLARSWFPDARWATAPRSAEDLAARGRPLAGARFRGAAVTQTPVTGELELTPGSTLTGPSPLEESDAARFALPRARQVYSLSGRTPETVGWLHAVARNTGGAVLVDGDITRAVVGASVNLRVSSARALPAEEAMGLVRRVAPRAVLVGSGDAGYLLEVPSSYDGSVLVDVRTVPGGVEHRFRWLSPSAVAVFGAPPGATSLDAIARERLVPVVAKIALRLLGAVPGEATDADGLVVTTAELERRAQR
jgi:hypothetical protein